MTRSFLRSKSNLLLKRPLVVGTLIALRPVSSQLRAAKSADVDVIELRLDSFAKVRGPFQRVQEFGRALIREIKTKTGKPVLLTLRSPNEGGSFLLKNQSSNARRAEILARLLPSVEMVDVEIREADFARRMTVIAHIHGVDVIHSVHDFSGPGRFSDLAKLSRRSRELKGDVFKAAVMPRTNDDLEKFLAFGGSLNNPRKILIGMGQAGLMSRVVGFSFGSILTYGHLGSSAAPGQMAAKELKGIVETVYFDETDR